jgi:protein-S-isoprenylcysteine O-methyltransferase Ste14
MIGKHILLTLMVGGGACALWWLNPPPEWNGVRVAGMGLLVGGFIFWTIARFQLGASFAVRAEARKLITGGLYSKIRNPIYVFGSWVIAGAILAFGKPVWLLILVVLIPLQLWRASKESAVLEAAFGDEYRTYKAGTWF